MKIECNICGWQGRKFLSDPWHPETVCPVCYSQVRHRLIAAALARLEDVSMDRIVRNKRALHFAPEPLLAEFLKPHLSQHVSADLMRQDVDRNLDITDMKEIGDGSFDLVIACDVLEHVEDDGRALAEILRVLTPGGVAILTVPQKDRLKTTYEDPSVTSPQERERLFGQEDHLRIYGDDFPEILTRAGFDVTVVNETNFTKKQVRRQVLFPPVLSSKPLATNYRKVFFARKPGNA